MVATKIASPSDLVAFNVASSSGFNARKIKRAVFGIDSLTASPSYATLASTGLIALMKAKYGDGGPGLVFVDNGATGFYYGGVGTGIGLFTAAGAWNTGPKSHSLAGYGVGYVGASGGYAGLDAGASWDRARVFIELGTGGAVTAGQLNTANSAIINGQTADTTTHPTGQLLVVDVYRDTATSTSTYIGFNVDGTANLFAVEFLNDAGGFVGNVAALGGTTLAQHASLDDTFYRQWTQALRADAYILNGGMNDRTGTSLPQVSGYVETLVSRWQSCPRTNVMLVRSNDSQDAGTTLLGSYDKMLKTIAMGRGCGYFDNRSVSGFADYTTAVNAGLMLDTIHPNATGGARIAAGHYSYMNL